MWNLQLASYFRERKFQPSWVRGPATPIHGHEAVAQLNEVRVPPSQVGEQTPTQNLIDLLVESFFKILMNDTYRIHSAWLIISYTFMSDYGSSFIVLDPLDGCL